MEEAIPLTDRTELSTTKSIPHRAYEVRGSTNSIRHVTKHFHVFKDVLHDTVLIVARLQTHAKAFWVHVGLFFVLLVALAVPVFTGFILQIHSGNINGYCDPGGNFNFAQTYNRWAMKYAFQITLGFGRLSFAQAKAIDVAWDVVVGRGGQFLLATICFRIFSKYLQRILERPDSSISYDVFRAIVFERPTLGSAFKLSGDVRSKIGWRSTMSILWMITASLYIVLFPTITSAMTGYSSNVDPFIGNSDNTNKRQANSSDFHRAIYRINNASRIKGLNLSDNYIVGSNGFAESRYDTDLQYYYCLQQPTDYRKYVDCLLAHGIAEYIIRYGSNSSLNNNSTLHYNQTYINIGSPALSVEVFNTTTLISGWGPLNLTMGNDSRVTGSPPMYTVTGDTAMYNETQINKLGACYNQTTYMWGFSFILLFSFFAITGIWVLGMYAMWNDTFWNSKLDRAGRKMGFYRGVVDVSNAMWKDMLKQPVELASESKIRQMIADNCNGGRITFEEIHHDELPPSRKDVFRQFKKEVPSLHGWTRAWTLLHWIWCMIFVFCGFASSFLLLAHIYENNTMFVIANIFSLTIAGAFWLATVSMLLIAIPGFTRFWSRIPLLSRQFRVRTTAYWVWGTVFAIVGSLAFYVAIATPWRYSLDGPTWIISMDWEYHQYYMWDSVNIACCMVTGVLWLIASIMILVGASCTLWRWLTRLKNAMSRSGTNHKAVPTTEDTSYTRPTLKDTMPRGERAQYSEIEPQQ